MKGKFTCAKTFAAIQLYSGDTLFNAPYTEYFPSCLICVRCRIRRSLWLVWWAFNWKKKRQSVKEKIVPKWQHFEILMPWRSKRKIHIPHITFLMWTCVCVCLGKKTRQASNSLSANGGLAERNKNWQKHRGRSHFTSPQTGGSKRATWRLHRFYSHKGLWKHWRLLCLRFNINVIAVPLKYGYIYGYMSKCLYVFVCGLVYLRKTTFCFCLHWQLF